MDDAKTRITEISAEDVLRRFRKGEAMNLVDVREYREYLNSHIGNALHIGKGVIERDIEQNYRDLDAELILYCGGGYRSALAADAIQRWAIRRYALWPAAFVVEDLGGQSR